MAPLSGAGRAAPKSGAPRRAQPLLLVALRGLRRLLRPSAAFDVASASPVQVIGSNSCVGRKLTAVSVAVVGRQVDQADVGPVAVPELLRELAARARLERAGERRRLDQRVPAVHDVERHVAPAEVGARRRSPPSPARSTGCVLRGRGVELPAREGLLERRLLQPGDRDRRARPPGPAAARRRRRRARRASSSAARRGQLDAVGHRAGTAWRRRTPSREPGAGAGRRLVGVAASSRTAPACRRAPSASSPRTGRRAEVAVLMARVCIRATSAADETLGEVAT